MPLFATLLGNLFGSLVQFFAKTLSKKLAIALAAIATLVSLTAAYIAALVVIANSIFVTLPPSMTMGLGHMAPDNWQFLVPALIAAHTARFAYHWNTKVVQLKLF